MVFKQSLARAFFRAVKARQLKQNEVALLVGMSQQRVSDFMRGDVVDMSERKILECLFKIGCDIDVTVKLGRGVANVTYEEL